jgi:predicted transcriptional regulator
MGKFTSTNILEKYEDEFNEPVKLSVISTYLSRFAGKGRVDRTRTGREWTYQSTKITQKQL